MPRGKSQRARQLIEEMISILQVIQPASVRATCYQLFVRKIIQSMAKSVTNGVGVQLLYARENDIIPWEWIVDETRKLEGNPGWDNKEKFKLAALHSYRLNRWVTQPIRVEVWSEKGTVRGTLMPVFLKYGINFRVMHGFSSGTVLHDVVILQQQTGVPLIVLYVGDFDPSGRYMVEVDLPNRLRRLWEQNKVSGSFNITIVPVALTKKDCKMLPSFPAKRSDTRFKWFVERYGYKAWELDALSPAILRRRVEQAILRQHIDWEGWARIDKCEEAEQASLENVLGEWQRITESISGQATK
jgi:hypothetical protein